MATEDTDMIRIIHSKSSEVLTTRIMALEDQLEEMTNHARTLEHLLTVRREREEPEAKDRHQALHEARARAMEEFGSNGDNGAHDDEPVLDGVPQV